ncbi:MAG: acyl-CoA dehydrogenase [Betaproteobacteria bacterium]|nr:acyl-CoA dehydrogenase [Betaproteobacteria bacterium]
MNAPRAEGLGPEAEGALAGEGRRDFSHYSLNDALDNASALVPRLRDRAKATEQARCMLPATVDDLHASGLLRIVQPKRWGGMELPFDSLVRIPAELARGCASTAWCVGNWAIHHWMLALYEEQAQCDIWDPQGRARAVAGGYVLSGYWNFSSGVDPSPWNMLAALLRDGDHVVDYLMCLVPRADYEIIDDWHVMGMSGTGSKSVKAENVFVPSHRALSMLKARGGREFPGAAIHHNPLFSIGLSTMGSHCLVGAAIGNAQAALDASIALVEQRSTSYQSLKMRDLPTVQQRLAAAGARIDAARALALEDCALAQRMAEAGQLPGLLEKLRPKRNVAFAVQLCTEAVDSLHSMAGANGIYHHDPLQGIFRDAHALMGHFGFSWDAQSVPWGAVAVGSDYKAPATL